MAKDRLNIYIPTRLKRRLKSLAEDKNMKMNDLVVMAISDMLDRVDMEHSSPDIVVERMSQLLNSQMAVITELKQMREDIDELKEAHHE